jgi:hypothetical protein
MIFPRFGPTHAANSEIRIFPAVPQDFLAAPPAKSASSNPVGDPAVRDGPQENGTR